MNKTHDFHELCSPEPRRVILPHKTLKINTHRRVFHNDEAETTCGHIENRRAAVFPILKYSPEGVA
jgi:hypothetical protein